MTEYDVWQQSECARLGITKEQHDKLVEIDLNYANVGLSGAYDFICSLIVTNFDSGFTFYEDLSNPEEWKGMPITKR